MSVQKSVAEEGQENTNFDDLVVQRNELIVSLLFCLVSLRPAFTVYAWLLVSVVFVLVLVCEKNLVATVNCLLWSLICLSEMLSACNTYTTPLHNGKVI